MSTLSTWTKNVSKDKRNLLIISSENYKEYLVLRQEFMLIFVVDVMRVHALAWEWPFDELHRRETKRPTLLVTWILIKNMR